MEKIGAFAEKWGVIGVAAAGVIYYLQDKITGQARCNAVHKVLDERIDDTFSNVRGEIDSKFNSLKDTINNFKQEMIEQTTENKERIEGISERMSHHYQNNTQQYIEILQEIRGLKK